MFRFLSHSPYFAKGNPSPMVNAQKAQPLTAEGKDFENTSNVNPDVFPEPRLQTDDVARHEAVAASRNTRFCTRHSRLWTRTARCICRLDDAMKLIEERGLPVKPATPTAVTQKAAPAKVRQRQERSSNAR